VEVGGVRHVVGMDFGKDVDLPSATKNSNGTTPKKINAITLWSNGVSTS
jgi:hypothetical protein